MTRDERAPAAASPRKKGRGCLATGCLGVLGLALLSVVVGGALLLRVPQQFGIWPSGARLLQGTPDRESAAQILAQVEAAGVDTTGLSLYVLPVGDGGGSLAYALLDVSAGFQFPTGPDANPLPDMFGRLASGPTVDAAHIEQVAIAYRDASGRNLGVLTASTEVIREFVGGKIDEQEFSAQLHGDIDPLAALQAADGP